MGLMAFPRQSDVARHLLHDSTLHSKGFDLSVDNCIYIGSCIGQMDNLGHNDVRDFSSRVLHDINKIPQSQRIDRVQIAALTNSLARLASTYTGQVIFDMRSGLTSGKTIV
ncbi:MAG TPA: hypothetical protein DHW71_01155 [Gammaproteobacteria bacterium]|nr:hypothetical protein [Gammaproteobacteria bacterium]MEC8012522.1 hypothetical protein [Pseudomonadota bacterium]HBF09710.1 hypothetical protein [Gammaproteobacteria bacterium]HCK91558.1 hypothetical protein [Gammaproteobacteria bacterium]|tara:strand:+ start:715 stop:1047 length:333 start_codon:yes stop_codon:yes gene_type:complete